jgi:molybdenum cofactor cytidylyltransferase
VLAAGASRRLPGAKQLLRLGGVTLLRHAARTALDSDLGPVVVVLGAASLGKQLRFELVDLKLKIVDNPRWKLGMSGSIRAGLDALEHPGPLDAALLMTCDQPFVTAALLKRLAGALRAARAPAAGCAYADTVGVPALFERSLFAELRALEGDQGAKRVLERHRDAVARVPFEDAAVDIDTPEDVLKLTKQRP